jgi:SAM-dependent methyltransferase
VHSKISLNELHQKFDIHLKNQSEKWSSLIYAKEKGFYQGFDELEIDGWRSTEKRFADYDIESYLSLDKSALDIGSNCGFFTLHSSKFVKRIFGVEINPYLISIADDAKNFLNINNTFFHNSSFEQFNTDKRFDIIFSLANDSTIDQNTTFDFFQYVDKILQLLTPTGILIFECQAADMMPPSKFDPKLDHLKTFFKILEQKTVKSEYPVNVPERIFLVLQRL